MCYFYNNHLVRGTIYSQNIHAITKWITGIGSQKSEKSQTLYLQWSWDPHLCWSRLKKSKLHYLMICLCLHFICWCWGLIFHSIALLGVQNTKRYSLTQNSFFYAIDLTNKQMSRLMTGGRRPWTCSPREPRQGATYRPCQKWKITDLT